MDRFDICKANAVLERDYNLGGWRRERPRNQRRMQATSVQLKRRQFRPSPNLNFNSLSQDSKDVYLTNVLRWNLPREADMNALIHKTYAEDWLRAEFPSAPAEAYSTAQATA